MSEHLDVLIIGAGLSGIAAGYRVQTDCHDKRYLILERRDAIGGTWDLFRYPGIRSDSDMFTLGFPFRPWTGGQSIADGEAIRTYIEDTAREFGIDEHIRFGHEVLRASWSSASARWTVEVRDHRTDEVRVYTCAFLFGCAGYYRYDQGYTPEFAGVDDFVAGGGTLIHPQRWPEELDYAGKRVIVIGSGATAVTLVPALAKTAAEVTMLQRSPTYVVSLPAFDGLAESLERVLPASLTYDLVRWKNILRAAVSYSLCRHYPKQARKLLIEAARRELPEDFDVQTHFNPRYEPWDERLCVIPDADLFKAIRGGRAKVVTEHIERFTAAGLRLSSGRELEADIIVTATGLELQLLGNVALELDGEAVDMRELMTYRGAMFSDLPNFAMVFGYINASWTLKADLICRYMCRLINHLDARGLDYVVPRLRDPSVEPIPFSELRAGYIRRAMTLLPRQGSKAPWKAHQNYLRDLVGMGFAGLDDGALEFGRRTNAAAKSDEAAA